MATSLNLKFNLAHCQTQEFMLIVYGIYMPYQIPVCRLFICNFMNFFHQN
jgi:hypothetical protein